LKFNYIDGNNKGVEMEMINIEILNPKVKDIIYNLAELKLISIQDRSSFTDLLQQLRRHYNITPTFEEITNEVELVREKMNNYES
jgi:hypothetical protein